MYSRRRIRTLTTDAANGASSMQSGCIVASTSPTRLLAGIHPPATDVQSPRPSKNMKIKCYVCSLASALLFPLSGLAQTVSVSVPGTSNPYLAGMPDGSLAAPDRAPYQSPVEVTGLDLSAGGVVSFNDASGGVSNTPFCTGTNCSSIDGNVYQGRLFYDHDAGAQNGMSDIKAPINSLVGVFLTGSAPDLRPPPPKLDFQAIGLDFTSLAPQVQQVFFIGDGRTSDGVMQEFFIPASASRLFLGTMDGVEWLNNSGGITLNVAQVVPEADTYAMFFAGLVLLHCAAKRRRAGLAGPASSPH